MIFSNVSRLGDFLLVLPVASWYYKKYGEKIHWVLSDNFPLYKKIEELVLMQEFSEKVSYVNVGTDAHLDWKFDPAKFGIQGEYRNFGFWSTVDRYFPEYYAERYGYEVDNDFIINLGEYDRTPLDYPVWIQSSPYRYEFGKFEQYIPENCIELTSDFITDARLATRATEVYCTAGGFTALLDLCNVKCNIYAQYNFIEQQRNKETNLYYRNEHNYYLI